MRHLLAIILITALAACGMMPVRPIVRVDCPQPTAEALAAPSRLPAVPEIPAAPEEAVRILGIVIERDKDVHQGEVDKREALIRHGVDRCGWTR